jgi:hypothetical protein
VGRSDTSNSADSREGEREGERREEGAEKE